MIFIPCMSMRKKNGNFMTERKTFGFHTKFIHTQRHAPISVSVFTGTLRKKKGKNDEIEDKG